MIFTKQIRILFVVPLLICIVLILFTAFYSWFLEIVNNVDRISTNNANFNTSSPFYTLICNNSTEYNLNTVDQTQLTYEYSTETDLYYIYLMNNLLCTMEYHEPISLVPYLPDIWNKIHSITLSSILTSNINKIIQIMISLAAIELVLIIAVINIFAKKIALIVAAPIDELTNSLRNIDQNNIDEYFSERLQGESSKLIPDEMQMLLRSVYDFIGIVKIANEAFIQGNDGQAIIGYAVANQFYLENGNKLGAGVIQNNMGVIHIRNRRFQEATYCFREAIICIENEWEKYKHKYESVGIYEDELIIDQEYQNLSKIVFNRCFNLCEALSEFLLTEILELQEVLFSHQHQRQSIATMESMIHAQVEGTHTIRQKAVSVFNQDDDMDSQKDIEKIIKVKGNTKRNLQDLQKLNDIMYTIRSQFLGTHDFQNSIIIQNIDKVTEKEIQFLITQLWRDAINTYEYCQKIMQFHLNKKKQKQLYITLKLIIGYLQNGQMSKSEELTNLATQQYEKIKEKYNDTELGHVSLLAQKLYLQRGLVQYKKNNKLQAAKELVKSLCIDGKFSSRDRMQALVMLKAIFLHFQRPVLSINKFLIQYQPIAKDWIIILDGSFQMKQNLAIVKACQTLCNIVKNIQSPNDRVSYGILREDYYEFIPLIGKIDNTAYIEKIFQLFPKPKGICNFGLIESIIKKYIPHSNLITIEENQYLTKDGVAFMRFKKVVIFACWSSKDFNIQIDDELNIIQFSNDENISEMNQNIFVEDDWSKILSKHEQLLPEKHDSNYFLEQIL